MATIIRWTEQSANDLELIFNFISRDSEHYATLFIKEIFKTIERLETFPESGRIVPEFNVEIVREIILGNYRIIYRLNKDAVDILTIHHSSQLFRSRLSDFE
jgi:addiction module RelE/StbE family toxin